MDDDQKKITVEVGPKSAWYHVAEAVGCLCITLAFLAGCLTFLVLIRGWPN